jgi:hypothetical protein
MSIRFAFDRSTNRSYDPDGRLRVRDSVITAAVISPYLGSEIPDPDGSLNLDPNRTYKLLRPADELRRAVKSFDGVPLLDQHQPTSAADHPKERVIGAVWNPRFDGHELIADLVIWPKYASQAVESGHQRSLSAGYAFRADMRPTVWQGERADGRMVDITANHVARVVEPRVQQAMVADSAFSKRSNKVRHHNTFRGIYLAADKAIRRRKARDAEPASEELDNEVATPEDLAAIVEEWCQDMEPAAVERLFERLLEIKSNHETSSGLDADTWTQENMIEHNEREGEDAPWNRRSRASRDAVDRATVARTIRPCAASNPHRSGSAISAA